MGTLDPPPARPSATGIHSGSNSTGASIPSEHLWIPVMKSARSPLAPPSEMPPRLVCRNRDLLFKIMRSCGRGRPAWKKCIYRLPPRLGRIAPWGSETAESCAPGPASQAYEVLDLATAVRICPGLSPFLLGRTIHHRAQDKPARSWVSRAFVPSGGDSKTLWLVR